MGNVVDKVASHKIEILLLAAITASGYLLFKQQQQKDELKKLLVKALQAEE